LLAAPCLSENKSIIESIAKLKEDKKKLEKPDEETAACSDLESLKSEDEVNFSDEDD